MWLGRSTNDIHEKEAVLHPITVHEYTLVERLLISLAIMIVLHRKATKRTGPMLDSGIRGTCILQLQFTGWSGNLQSRRNMQLTVSCATLEGRHGPAGRFREPRDEDNVFRLEGYAPVYLSPSVPALQVPFHVCDNLLAAVEEVLVRGIVEGE